MSIATAGWPLACLASDTIDSCVRSGRCPLQMALAQVSLFYVTAAIAKALHSRGALSWGTHFASAFDVAWLVPMTVLCVPMSVMALQAWTAAVMSDDISTRWGDNGVCHNQLLVESATMFATYVLVDAVLISVHGLGGLDTWVHHVIFGCMAFLSMHVSWPIMLAAMLSQELSTPFLNLFLILRGFKGSDSLLVQLVFLCFALTFFATRIVLNSHATFQLLREVYRIELLGLPSVLGTSATTYYFIAFLFSAAWALQMWWGITIAKKAIKATSGSAKPKVREE